MGLVKDTLDGDCFRAAWGVALRGRGETRGRRRRRRVVVFICVFSTLFYRVISLFF